MAETETVALTGTNLHLFLQVQRINFQRKTKTIVRIFTTRKMIVIVVIVVMKMIVQQVSMNTMMLKTKEESLMHD